MFCACSYCLVEWDSPFRPGLFPWWKRYIEFIKISYLGFVCRATVPFIPQDFLCPSFFHPNFAQKSVLGWSSPQRAKVILNLEQKNPFVHLIVYLPPLQPVSCDLVGRAYSTDEKRRIREETIIVCWILVTRKIRNVEYRSPSYFQWRAQYSSRSTFRCV